MIELQSEERSRIWHLCYEWQEAKAALDEFEFDIEEFKRLAKESFDWLEKFFCELILYPKRQNTLTIFCFLKNCLYAQKNMAFCVNFIQKL